jgi:hypothetical protein
LLAVNVSVYSVKRNIIMNWFNAVMNRLYRIVCWVYVERIQARIFTLVRIWIWFFTLMRIRIIRRFTLVRIRFRLLIQVMRNFNHWPLSLYSFRLFTLMRIWMRIFFTLMRIRRNARIRIYNTATLKKGLNKMPFWFA